MSERLVSILTPCYNTGHLLWRLLESVLEQTYPHIEMFIIDDGSSDNTREVWEQYAQKFQAKEYALNYIYQENQGQSTAINNGLKLIKGEYLIWPDSDDWFRSKHAISSFVKALEERDDSYAVVRCVPIYINETDMKERTAEGYTDSVYQFANCLFNRCFFWGAGNYMVKTMALDLAIPNREIYVAKNAGQNWQLLLPILYNFKCVTISDALYSILERNDSHSRGLFAETLDRELLRVQAYEETIIATLKAMLMNEYDKNKYIAEIRNKYIFERLNLSIEYQDGKSAMAFYKQYYLLGGRLPVKRLVILYCLYTPIIQKLYSIYRKRARK